MSKTIESSSDENRQEHKKWDEEMSRMVRIEEGHIVVNVVYEYNIPLSRCKTHEQIFGWAFHLTEKTWMTMEVLRHFIMVACRQNKLDIPSP